MNRNWRIFCLLMAATLGWWTAAGLEYVAGEAAQKEAAAEPKGWNVEMTDDSPNLTGSPSLKGNA